MHITPLHPGFVGEASGIDISVPLSPDQVAAIEAGMDRYAVLVFRDQPLTDEQQCAYSRNFGELEATLIGQMSKPGERRLGPVEMGDISNLIQSGKLRGRDDSRRMYALGNRLWHSDASFRATGAGYSLLSARVVPGYGGNTEFADMRAAYDALDDADQDRDRRPGHRTFHRLLPRRARFRRLRRGQRRQGPPGAPSPGADASGDRTQVAVPVGPYRHHRRLAGAGGARLHPRPDRTRDAAAVHPRASVAGQRPRHVGQPHDDASCQAVSRSAGGARPAPHLDQGNRN